MTNQEIIAVVTAAEAGKRIEEKSKALGIHGEWERFRGPWDFVCKSYRVALEPLEAWVNVYPDTMAAHETEQKARSHANGTAVRTAVRMREVVE